MTFSTDLGLAAPHLILAGAALVLLVWGAFQPRAGAAFTVASVGACWPPPSPPSWRRRAGRSAAA